MAINLSSDYFIHLVVVIFVMFVFCLADQSNQTSSTGSDQDIKCPHRWRPGPNGGSCYRFWPESSKSWENARKTCLMYGAELLKFDSVMEKIFVIKEVMKYSVDNEWWIGLKRDPNNTDSWLWTDGTRRNESDNFLQWGHDEPNNFRGQEDCAEIWDNLLNDKNCRQLLQFICERPRDIPSMCDVDNGWDNHGRNNCYKFFDEKLTLQEARFKCFDNDADLLVITDEQEQEVLTDFIRHEDKSSTWLKLSFQQVSLTTDAGGKDEFDWSWNLTYPLSTSWWRADPENTMVQNKSQFCSVMVSNTSGYSNWEPENCSSKHKVMCMKSKGTTCRNGYRQHDGRCYIVHFTEPMRWIDAKSYCTLRGTELLQIKSESQRDFVMSLLKLRGDGETKVWVALKGQNSSWAWDTGEALGTYEQIQLVKVNGTGCIFMTLDGDWKIADCAELALPVCSLPVNTPVMQMKPTTASRYACPLGYFGPVDGQCYRRYTDQLDWASARLACQAEGSDLAVFPTQESYLYVKERVQENVWIGLNDRSQEGKHQWLDQNDMADVKFWKNIAVASNITIGGIYTGNCAVMYNKPDIKHRGQWFDTPCNLLRNFLCCIKGELNIAIGKKVSSPIVDLPKLFPINDGVVDPATKDCLYAFSGLYFQMDLGAAYPIKKIVLYFASSMCPYCKDLKPSVFISNKAMDMVPNSLVVTNSRIEDGEANELTLPNVAYGRFVVVKFKDSLEYPMLIPVCEMQVFEDSNEPVDRTQGKASKDGGCGDRWLEDTSGICYYKGQELLSWADAESTCQSLQANLAMPIDITADSFITGMLKSDLTDRNSVVEAWLGASKTDDRQKDWTTVLPSSEFKLRRDTMKQGPMEGQAICALFYLDNTLNRGLLKTNGCLDRKPFVCQYDSSIIKIETKHPGLHTSLQNLARKILIKDSAIKFQIKGVGGAEIKIKFNSDIIEIKLCSLNNKKSAILINGTSVKTHWISDLCNDTYYTQFYVSWKDGKVGRGTEIDDQVIMTWNASNAEEEDVHLFVSSLSSSTIFWKFQQDMTEEKENTEKPLKPAVNLAVGKHTTQSSTFGHSIRSTSYNAIDGCTSTVHSSGCCTHTLEETNPYWSVDLGQTHVIKEIIIYRRTDCCAARLYNFTVSLSYWDRSGMIHEEQVYQQKGSLVPETTRIPTPGKRARTVKIEIPGNRKILELCEVMVYQDLDFEDCGSDDWHVVKFDKEPSCVHLSDMKLSWSHAKMYCTDHGSDLGFPESPQLQLFLYDLMFKNGRTSVFPDIWVDDPNSISSGDTNTGQCTALGIQNNQTRWNYVECDKENIFFCKDQVLTTTTKMTTTTVVTTLTTTTTPTTTEISNVTCESGWTANLKNRACYRVYLEKNLNVHEAMFKCLKMGARLTDIADAEEQNFISDVLKTSPSYSEKTWDSVFVAGIELAEERNWSWYLYDTPWFDDIKWSPGQPDNFQLKEDCSSLRVFKKNFGEMNDVPCTWRDAVGYICKKVPTENICPEDWLFDVVDKSCFSISYQKMSWHQAEALCEASLGQLTDVASQQELNFIGAIQAQKGRYWIGATYKPDDDWFEWLYRSKRWSGLKVEIDSTLDLRGHNWKLCGAIENGVLFLTDCEQKLSFICKYTGIKATVSTTAMTQVPSSQSGQTGSKDSTKAKPTDTTPGQTIGHVDSLCGEGWFRNPDTDSCYMISLERTTWDEAQSICVEAAGNLVSIQTMAEQHYLTGRLSGLQSMPKNLWTGANNHDPEKGWKWTDGGPFAYFYWQPLQPDDLYEINKDKKAKGCGTISSIKSARYFGKWDDLPCDSLLGYICKKIVREREVTATTTAVTSSDEYYGCPADGWLEYRSSCFLVVQEKKDWDEASDYCRQQGSDLASFASENEQNFVFSQLPQDSYCFNIWKNNTQCTEWAERGECNHNPVWMAKHCHLACKKCFHNCRDLYLSSKCTEWAEDGECEKNPDWMIPNCAQSCGVCEGAPTRGFWMGLLRKPHSRTYEWSDHSAMQYTGWSHRQPTAYTREGKSCGAMFIQTGKWNDGECSISLPGFVCKQKKQLLPKTTKSESKTGCEDENSYGYGPYCYIYIEDQKTFENSKQDCIDKGGSLAVIEDVYVQAFVASELANMIEDHWIGLFLKNNTMLWVNEKPVSFTHFDKKFSGVSKLDDSCFAMKTYLGAWVPHDCASSMPYICQKMRVGFTTPVTTTAMTTQTPPPCHDMWLQFKGNCYHFYYNFGMNWMEAEEYCNVYGASLVSIHSREENVFIHSFSRGGSIHIGLNDRDSEGTFVWSDGSPFNYDEFRDVEPNNAGSGEDCAELTGSRPVKNWNDNDCAVERDFACKITRGKSLENTGTSPKPSSEGCDGDPTWDNFGGDMCYYFENSNFRTWYDAYDDCIQRGGNLASIHSQEEQNNLTSLITGATRVTWIGYNRLTLNNEYAWSDGSPVGYTAWHRTQPNDNQNGEKCAVMDMGSGQWHDYNCNDEMSYLCMKHKAGMAPPTTPSAPIDGGCPDEFIPYDSKCYLIKTGDTVSYTFSEAKASCERQDAELASIHSSLEQAFITSNVVRLKKGLYIGFVNLRGRNQFDWIDNSRIDFTNWNSGEPSSHASIYDSEKCVEMYTESMQAGKWNNIQCDKHRGYICSRPKDPSLPKKEEKVSSDLCPVGYTYYFNACYKLNKTPATWDASAAICKEDQASLATILSPHEQAFVEVLVGDNDMRVWINGKYDHIRGFYWLSGEAVHFLLDIPVDYYYDMYNDDSSCIVSEGQMWDAISCGSNQLSVCKIKVEKPTEKPTTSTYVQKCRDPSWLLYEGHCYVAVQMKGDYHFALSQCLNNDMKLASIHDSRGSTALMRYLDSIIGRDKVQEFWIGLVGALRPDQAAYIWLWSDSSPLSYTNFAVNDGLDQRYAIACIHVNNMDSFWYKGDCTTFKGFICKEEAETIKLSSTTAASTNSAGVTSTQVSSAVTNKTQTDKVSSTPYAPWNLPPFGQADPAKKLAAEEEESMTGGEIAGIVLGVLFSIIIVSVCIYVIYNLIIKKTRYGVSKTSLGFDNALFHKTDETVSIDG